MIKILPHILCRVGGMSFSEIEAISFSDDLLLLNNKLVLIQKKFETQKIELLQLLKQIKPIIEDFSAVKKIKKQVYKNQLISTEKVEHLDKFLLDKLLTYNDLLASINSKEILFKIQFEQEVYQQQLELQRLAKRKNFQKALPLSSISFAKRLDRYLAINPKNFRKKEFQTERTVMQYLARMAAKTSPFSSFTTVSYGKIVNQKKSNKLIESKKIALKNNHQCVYNNQILEVLQTLFLTNDAFLSPLNVRLNPTLTLDNNNYRFLINHQNIEVFQTIEVQDFLTIIKAYFEEKTQFSIDELTNLITEDYETEFEIVFNFLKELIAIGFLEVDFGYNSTTQNWFIPLKNYFKKVACITTVDIAFVDKLAENIDVFGEANKNQRILILEQTLEMINTFIHRHFSGNPIGLELSPEQLIYEDVANGFEFEFDAQAVQSLINSLHHLLESLHFLQGKERLQIAYFFNQQYGKEAIVPLLDFYEQYFKIGKKIVENDIPTIQNEAQLLKKWTKEIKQLVIKKYNKKEVLKIELIDLQRINDALNIQLLPLNNISLSCFAQVFEETNKLKAVVNAVSAGYGKMTGRFLNLMPNEFTKDLKTANLHLQTTENIIVDNVDASYFNANLHPSLCDFEITMPNGQNQLSKTQQINVNELFIRYINNQLVLWHMPLNREIQVLDLGIQTPKGRSPLYQLLTNFSPIIPDINYLRQTIEKAISDCQEESLKHFPTVEFENLILSRQRIKYPDMVFLTQKGKISDAKNWQKICESNFFKNFAYQFYRKEIEWNKAKMKFLKPSKKPMYFNMNNIILLNTFFKTKQSKKYIYELINILPKVEKLFKIDNKKYFLESVFQWYKYQ